MRRPACLLTLLLALTSPACGGGGSGALAPQAVEFHYDAVTASVTGSTYRRTIGTAVVQPDGALVAELETPIVGAPRNPFTQMGELSLEQDGSAALTAGGVELLRGFRSESGAVVIMATTGESGALPGLAVMVRRAPGLQAPDLAGLFALASARRQGSQWAALTQGIAFGDAGAAVTMPHIRNTDTFVSSSLEAPKAISDYEVEGGLVSHADEFGSARFTGAMTDDREFVWVGETTSATVGGGLPEGVWTSTAMVRMSTNASNAVFSGRYGFVSLKRNSQTARYDASRGVLTADGAGGVTFGAFHINREGVPVQRVAISGVTSAVNPRGEMILQFSPTSVFAGGISPSGRYAVLAGASSQGSPPEVWVLVRLAGP